MRWDPNRENSLFFDQSATLYSTYYHVQILIHRPFIPSRECSISGYASHLIKLCTFTATMNHFNSASRLSLYMTCVQRVSRRRSRSRRSPFVLLRKYLHVTARSVYPTILTMRL